MYMYYIKEIVKTAEKVIFKNPEIPHHEEAAHKVKAISMKGSIGFIKCIQNSVYHSSITRRGSLVTEAAVIILQ